MTRWSPLAGLLLGLAAAAEPAPSPLFHAGSGEAAALRAVARTGVDEALTPTTLPDWLAGRGPSLIGDGIAWGCDPGAAAGRVSEHLETARRQLRVEQWQTALNATRLAEAALLCAAEDVSLDEARNIYELMATAAFRQACPDATCPESARPPTWEIAREAWSIYLNHFPNKERVHQANRISQFDGQAMALALARATPALAISLDVVPRQAALWVDGQHSPSDHEQPLVPGVHLLRVQRTADSPVRTFKIRVSGTTPCALVLADEVEADDVAWVGAETTRGALSTVAALEGEGQTFYVVDPQSGVWRGTSGAPDTWDHLPIRRSPLSTTGRWVALSGGAAAGAGVVTMLSACLAGRSAYDIDNLARATCGYDGDRSQDVMAVGQTLLVAGGGAGLVGLTLWGTAQLTLTPGPAPGLALRLKY